MRLKILPTLLAAAAAAGALAAPAGAASVAYIDGNNLWLSSPDGAAKVQLTSGGTADYPWRVPAQGRDGKTVVVHKDQFGDGSRRPVLYLYGADGKRITANVMPVYSGATGPVYPIGLDMDWSSNAVAYGYQYCGFACTSLYRGYWLTFSDNQGAFPTNPQGQSDAMFPTFYGKRVISSDSGGRIFVQPNVPEAPFTNGYQGWLGVAGLYLSRAEVAPAGNFVAVEWSRSADGGEGIMVGRHQGTVPSDVTNVCDLPVGSGSSDVTFSPDGRQMAWKDAQGVKVAGVPNLAAGTQTCTLTAPPRVISATGSQPSFGGANVAAILGARGGGGGGGGATKPPAQTPGTTPAALPVRLGSKATRAAFRKGITLRVAVAAAGRVDAAATVPARVARRLRLGRAKRSQALAAAASAEGIAAAAAGPVVVARGKATARRAGNVTIRLKPTAAARRAARRMRGVTLTIKVSQGAAGGSRKIKLRR